MRCSVRYGKYLNAFLEGDDAVLELKDIDTLTLVESKETIELTEEEKASYDKRQEQELSHLKIIGTKAEEGKHFTESVDKIKNNVIEI